MGRVGAIIRDRGGLSNAVRNAARRPSAVVAAMVRLLSSDWRKLACSSLSEHERMRLELAGLGLIDGLDDQIRAAFSPLKGSTIRDREVVPGGMRRLHAEMLWALVRARKPRLVVETGVCNGLSSAVLLEALARNGEGRLVSVDLPEFTDPNLNSVDFWSGKGGAAIPAGKEIGWLVREGLRANWRLEVGRSQEVLEPLLQELGPIDLFIHDSEHSYENQSLEFALGFAALRSGGVLVATDISWSDAFDHFWDQVRGGGAKRAYVDPSCAIVIKP